VSGGGKLGAGTDAPGPPPAYRRGMDWWTQEPMFQELAERLDPVAAVDNHTHLLWRGPFRPELDAGMPLGLRSTEPAYAAALTERFGVAVGRGGIVAAAEEAGRVRDQQVEQLGAAGYWHHHLDAIGTEVALVNQEAEDGADGKRLRWVPMASCLLYPLPAPAMAARGPQAAQDVAALQGELRRHLAGAGLAEVPADLDAYRAVLVRVLAGWAARGAVAVKFLDAYLRTIRYQDVPADQARALYARGVTGELSREEYLAVQDHLARHLFLEAGRLGLAVHIHSSHGVPPFLRAEDADVRNLEPVLTDVRYFGTQFVLIHGGAPLVEDAAYLALKPHVWVDISAQPFLYAVPELAANLRMYLRYAPEKVLFGTDVAPYPGVPGGPEVQHVALSAKTRAALHLALAGMVRDGVVDLEAAVRMGEGVLRGNAGRLYGLER
jgi:uncharacterized protein